MIDLQTLLQHVVVVEVLGSTETQVLDITTDSREVKPGWCFVAVVGSNFDGHTAIPEAVVQGASVVVCERLPETSEPGVVHVVVADSRMAFAIMSQTLEGHPSEKLTIVGVTGTNGKTTVATLIEQVLLATGSTAAFIGTTGVRYQGTEQYTGYTTPHARVLAATFAHIAKQHITHVSMEVSSHALHQARVAGVGFAGAVFTNLTRDHLDYHSTMDEYAAAKKQLFDGLSEDAVAVVNGDDAYGTLMLQHCKAQRTFKVGIEKTNDVHFTIHSATAAGCSFTLHPYNLEIRSPLVGIFNVYNVALTAVLCLEAFGIQPDVLQTALVACTGAKGRMERYELDNGSIVFVDYAHTPDALQNALQTLAAVKAKDAKIYVVFGCGGNRDAGKRSEMGRVASELADMIFLTNDNPRHENPMSIIRDIAMGIPKNQISKVMVEPKRDQAILMAIDITKEHDIVLVAGKGHEQFQIIGDEQIPCSDADIVMGYHT